MFILLGIYVNDISFKQGFKTPDDSSLYSNKYTSRFKEATSNLLELFANFKLEKVYMLPWDGNGK